MSDSPIAYYRLNDTGTVMADSGTHDLTGSYGVNVKHGGPALTSASGSQSSLFDGNPAGSDITSNTGTVPTNPLFATAIAHLTVEAWIKPAVANTTNRYIPIVSYGREAQGQAWVLQVTPQSTFNFWMKTVNGPAPTATLVSSTTLTPGTVYHVVATYDGAHIELYINGKRDAIVASTGYINYSNLVPAWGLAVGGAIGSTEPIFNGEISDVAIYAATLSATAIASHYALGNVAASSGGGSYTALVTASNPLVYYKLNDPGTAMNDSGTHNLPGLYGASVSHATPALTSAGDTSATFAGAPAGSAVAANSATVSANALFTLPTTGLTVEAWIKPTDYNRANSYVPIVSYGRQIIGDSWSLQVTPQSAVTFYIKVSTGGFLLAPVGRLLPGQIYHVVGTYDGSNARLYVNGELGSSLAVTGALDYSGITSAYGLAIGGALGGSLPIFNGSINDVAIYATALSSAVVEEHYLRGEIATPLVETPASSDAFVDSIGVVTHLRSSGTPYANSWSMFEPLLRASGIRHIADTLIASPASYVQHINALAGDGIRASLITSLGQTRDEIAAAIPAFQNMLEAVGGLNEPDISGDPNWANDTRAAQGTLWSVVKGNPATAYLKVVGPSMVTLGDALVLGDIGSYMDAGSIHDYFDGFNPGTSGWGGLSQYGIYGSITYNCNLSQVIAANRPIRSTETGYGNVPSAVGNIDNQTLARYVPRIFLEHFLHGIDRTTIYEFYDEPGSGRFDDFGLVDAYSSPKTSYYAIQSLIQTLADPGLVYSPSSVSYQLTGNLDNVHHLLLQKRNGTYELVLWVETEGYDPNAKLDIAVPAQSISLQPATVPMTASIATIGDSGKLTTSPLAFPGGVATFSIDDHVSIVSFHL